jgi:uncharacterized protein YutE (UPF0331/DUF86 family)/predicted nucleotidyltransferase
MLDDGGNRVRLAEMMDKQDISHLFEKEGVKLAFLFGSIIDSDTAADVDVAVLLKDYSFDAYLELYERLRQVLKTSDLDLVVLNRSNAAIKMEALLKGVLLFAEKQEALSDFAIDTLVEYEDFRRFKKEYMPRLQERSLEGLSMSERRFSKERMAAYLSQLDEAVGELSKLRQGFSSLEDFRARVETRELSVHYLRIALESVLNVCRHFLAVKGVSLTEINTTNLIELSGEKGLLNYDFARKIKGMAGMRNAIVHVYWRLDYEAIYRAITEELADFDEFARQVGRFLEKQP